MAEGAIHSERLRGWHLLILGIILLAAAGLRLHGIDRNGLWIDELYSVEFSGGYGDAMLGWEKDRIISKPEDVAGLRGAPGAWHTWTAVGDLANPPLYYLLLRLWRDCLGSSDLALRGFSVFTSVVAVGLLFELGRVLYGPGLALWGCVLMALAGPQIVYSQEARTYMLLTAIAVGAMCVLVRIEKFGWTGRRGILLGACVLALPLTHYFAVGGCLAMGIYAASRLRGKTRVRVLAVFAGMGLLYAVIWLPWMLSEIHGYNIQATWQNDFADPGFYGRWWNRLLLQVMDFFSHPSSSAAVAGKVVNLLLVLPVVMLWRGRGKNLLLPLLWAGVYIGFVAGTDFFRETLLLGYIRYSLAAAPGIYLLAAGLLADQRQRWMRHVIPAGLALYCVLSLPWTYAGEKADWRGFARQVGEHVRDGDVIVYHVPKEGIGFAGLMCVAVEHYVPGLRTHAVFATRPLERGAVDEASNGGHRIWVAYDASLSGVDLVPGFKGAESYYAFNVGYLVHMVPEKVGR